MFSFGETVHLRYARHADMMLAGGRPEEAGAGVVIYVNATEPVEDIAAGASTRGATVEGPTDTGHDTREARLWDPDGYELVFSEPVDVDRSFADVMRGTDGG